MIEHTAGVGGDAAKILGELLIDAIKQAKPELERDLLNKANAAIVKAADTKEVRLSLDSFLQGGPSVTKAKPGFASIVCTMASTADCSSNERRGTG